MLRLKNHSSFRCTFSLILRYVTPAFLIFSFNPIQRAVGAAWNACCGIVECQEFHAIFISTPHLYWGELGSHKKKSDMIFLVVANKL